MQTALWAALGFLAYAIVSNALWLLFGARVAQFLPGVEAKGIRGTFRLAAIFIMALVALARTLCLIPLRMANRKSMRNGIRDDLRWAMRCVAGLATSQALVRRQQQ